MPMPNGYGSSIICPPDVIRKIVLTIIKNILQRNNLIARHNLFVVYTYLCAEFSLGLRPRNRPALLICYETRTAVISDKQSVKYFEQRVLPLPKILFSLMLELKNGFESLKFNIARSLCPSAILYKWITPFFFIDEKSGSVEDFTIKKMAQIFMDMGISLDLPPNFPRHFARNYLYHEGIANDIIDAWFGHQHAGREMTNITSAAIPDRAMKECLIKIEMFLEKTGFEELKYLPQRTNYG